MLGFGAVDLAERSEKEHCTMRFREREENTNGTLSEFERVFIYIRNKNNNIIIIILGTRLK